MLRYASPFQSLPHFRLGQQAVAQIGGNAVQIPPRNRLAHDLATGIDGRISGALNRGREAVGSHDDGPQKAGVIGEAEVAPASSVAMLLCDDSGTTRPL